MKLRSDFARQDVDLLGALIHRSEMPTSPPLFSIVEESATMWYFNRGASGVGNTT